MSKKIWPNTGFGGRLRELRLAAGMTIEDLRRAGRLSLSYVSMLERGKHEPAWPVVRLLAQILNCSPNDFVPADGEPWEPFAELRVETPNPAGRPRRKARADEEGDTEAAAPRPRRGRPRKSRQVGEGVAVPQNGGGGGPSSPSP